MRVTLVLPPLTQLNTPYPSAGVLARALRAEGVTVTLRDLGIELALRLFSGDGLAELFDRLTEREELPEPAWRALANRRRHVALIGPSIRFLQGHDRGVMTRIHRGELPWGPRLAAAKVEDFGRLGMEDQARHLGTLYLADLADLVAAIEDPGFSLARYAHHLAAGPVTFDGLAARLQE
ncbi:radical SAM protein, partial [Myxococcota bacterium]|nr:radical SAM protein [Myxococcota bacterium]